LNNNQTIEYFSLFGKRRLILINIKHTPSTWHFNFGGSLIKENFISIRLTLENSRHL